MIAAVAVEFMLWEAAVGQRGGASTSGKERSWLKH